MVKRILKDDFMKNNLIFFMGTIFVAFLNYLYHPVLGRMMKVEDFGEVQAFLSFFLIIGVFTGFFRNVIITSVANIKEESDKEIVAMLRKASLILAFLFAIALSVFALPLAEFFNFSSHYYFFAFSLLVVLGVIGSNDQAVVQGVNNFKLLSFIGIVSGVVKLLASVLFVWLGWSIFGAIGGIVLSALVGMLIAFNYVKKNFQFGDSFKIKIDKRIKKELWYAILFLAVGFSITFLYSNDVIIIKKYFTPEEAGLYSGMAIVGRIMFFLVSSIPGVLLPSIKIDDKKGENKKVLIKSICFTGVLAGFALLAFSIFPELISRILMGEKYQEYAHFIPFISLYLFFVSFSNLFFYYLLALRKSYIILPAVAGPLTVLLLCFINHDSMETIINNFIIGSVLTFLLLLFPIIKQLLKKNGE